MNTGKRNTNLWNAVASLVCAIFAVFMAVVSETDQAISAFTAGAIILFLIAGICFTAESEGDQSNK